MTGRRAPLGPSIYLDGKPLKSEVLHDHLTRSILPRGGTSTVRQLLRPGVRSALRRWSEFNKGALDELRVFTKALSPVEVAYLHDPKAGAATSR